MLHNLKVHTRIHVLVQIRCILKFLSVDFSVYQLCCRSCEYTYCTDWSSVTFVSHDRHFFSTAMQLHHWRGIRRQSPSTFTSLAMLPTLRVCNFHAAHIRTLYTLSPAQYPGLLPCLPHDPLSGREPCARPQWGVCTAFMYSVRTSLTTTRSRGNLLVHLKPPACWYG